MSAFALVIPPADFSIHLQRLTQRSPTQHMHPKNYSAILLHCDGALARLRRVSEIAFGDACAAAASVHGLAPLHLPRRPTRLVSYYAFFKEIGRASCRERV